MVAGCDASDPKPKEVRSCRPCTTRRKSRRGGLGGGAAADRARLYTRGTALAVGRYLVGMLRLVEPKNGWQLAERAGKAQHYGMQRLLAEGRS